MIKFLLHLLFLCLLCVVLSRCKHEPPFDPATCGDAQTIEEMKQWVLFKPGTYWIYEEENTGYIDTVTVTEYFDGLSSGGFAAFGCVMHSSYDGYDYDYWFNDSYSGLSDDGCMSRRIECDKSKPGDFFGADYVFIFPLKVGRLAGLQWGGGEFGQFRIIQYPIDIQNGVESFNGCVKFNTPHAVQNDWTVANYVLSKNFGIVRKELVEMNETWNLIEYDIVQ